MSTIKLLSIYVLCFGALVIDQPTFNSLVLGFIAMMSAITAYLNTKHGHKLEAIAKVTDNTHTLVNSQMGAQLQIHTTTARILSDKFPENEEYRKAAKESEAKLAEHKERQARMDETPAPPSANP